MSESARAYRMCGWILLVLVASAFLFIAYNWLSYCSPVSAVKFAFSGSWFKDNFQHSSAGMALDQPTVGKFMLWTSALAYFGCSLIVLLRFVVGVEGRVARRVVTISAALIVVLLLIELLAPTFLLVQYIDTMGLAIGRVSGLFVCCCLWVLLPAFVIRIRKADPLAPRWYANAVLWTLAVTLVTPTYYVLKMLWWNNRSFHLLSVQSLILILAWLVLVAPMPLILWLVAQDKASQVKDETA